MLLGINKYLYKITILALQMIFSTEAYSQNRFQQQDSSLSKHFNPIFISTYKNPYQLIIPHVGRSYRVYYRKPLGLMYWPNYPLTAEQIAAREKKYEQSVGQQIAGDIAESIINNIIYGKKSPVAVRPRF